MDFASDDNLGLWGLFLSAFVSSTLLPGGSELVLALLVRESQQDPWLLLALASVGNTLGGLSMWLLGALIARGVLARRPPGERVERALQRLQRWGAPVLLLSWVPFLGDALCLAAGLLRTPLAGTAFFIAAGKTARYALVVAVSV